MNKRVVSKLEKILTIIGFVFCFVVITVFINRGVKKEANIEQNKFLTVGKIYEYTILKGRDRYDYFYYYEQIKYKNSSYTGIGQENKSISKFYILKLSTEHPENSIIDLDKEITDTTQILAAGFSKKDLVK